MKYILIYTIPTLNAAPLVAMEEGAHVTQLQTGWRWAMTIMCNTVLLSF